MSRIKIKDADIDVVVYNKFPKDYYDWLGCCFGNVEDGIIELTDQMIFPNTCMK